jgi:Protein of unknown function (DUF2934)
MQSGQDAVIAGSSPDIDLHELTRRRAEEIYVRNGRIPGRDVENWTQAEEEIRAEFGAMRRTAIVVRVSGVQYVGEYVRDAADGYTPGEFEPGAPVPVHLDGDRMFVKRPNGKVLETRIVQQIG